MIDKRRGREKETYARNKYANNLALSINVGPQFLHLPYR